MNAFCEAVRRSVTFLLAVFLWLHAFFFLDLNFHSSLISRFAAALRLGSSEVVLCALIVTFSLIAASGFWKTLGSLLYIYAFPLVLIGYMLRWSFLLLRALNRWFQAQAVAPEFGNSLVVEQKDAKTDNPVTAKAEKAKFDAKKAALEALRFLTRPFRRFIFLWCLLLVLTTHTSLAWVCLVVVSVQLAQQIALMLELFLFTPWLWEKLSKIGPTIVKPINDLLVSLAAVTRDVAKSEESKKLWDQLRLWKKILGFFSNRYLLYRWAWVFATVVLVSVYSYIAFLFSFVYYGIARVSGVSYPWPDAMVNSFFIPLFFSDLPKILAVKFVSGIHCALILGVGVGTILNFLGRKLDAIGKAASELSDRFADESIREKYLMLEQTYSSATNAPSSNTTVGK